MIYERVKEPLLRLLKTPRQPPEAPVGSPGSELTFRAAPNFLTYKLLVWGGGFAAAIAAELLLIIFGHSKDEGLAETLVGYGLLVMTIAASIGKYFLLRLDYDMRYYVVTDRSLRIREGALIIYESTYTFANVQNLAIHQGPLERLLGISNLSVETAGGAGGGKEKHEHGPFGRGHEGVLRGIADARGVRDRILVLLKLYRDAGLGDPEDRARRAPAPRGAVLTEPMIQRLREIRSELNAIG